ncbi:hypothetical protein CK203_098767 [Vitis vinifera]|uniref:Uncharacterized protein n=1 Tax=Vitis vinifera TaxID=29760 RepID=A0A438CUU8_VITVI|nr:hypothetical protein CK203_098767 [Vitis vinifera]
MEVSATEELACTCIGNNMGYLMGRETAMPARASARPFSIRLIFSIVHSVNCCKVSLTLASLETDRARARSNPDRMASYSASLLEAGNPDRMACSRCSPIGGCSRSPTPDPNDREAPSTRKVHHFLHLVPGVGWAFESIPVRSQPLLGLSWTIWRVGQLARPPSNRGGASGRRSEGLRLLAPFLNTWFLRPPTLY